MSEETVTRCYDGDDELSHAEHAAVAIIDLRDSNGGEWPAYKQVREEMKTRWRFGDVSNRTLTRGFALAGRPKR